MTFGVKKCRNICAIVYARRIEFVSIPQIIIELPTNSSLNFFSHNFSNDFELKLK
jgi:hypothetical protein